MYLEYIMKHERTLDAVFMVALWLITLGVVVWLLH